MTPKELKQRREERDRKKKERQCKKEIQEERWVMMGNAWDQLAQLYDGKHRERDNAA